MRINSNFHLSRETCSGPRQTVLALSLPRELLSSQRADFSFFSETLRLSFRLEKRKVWSEVFPKEYLDITQTANRF